MARKGKGRRVWARDSAVLAFWLEVFGGKSQKPKPERKIRAGDQVAAHAVSSPLQAVPGDALTWDLGHEALGLV